ncbi:MAG: hypothetical protein FWF75_00235, partial [Propionibacteriaceae bacterium]|nr:hypothetical protein [Propionibacteriaceae bacterium]
MSTQPIGPAQTWSGDEASAASASGAAPETPEDWLAERFADEFGGLGSNAPSAHPAGAAPAARAQSVLAPPPVLVDAAPTVLDAVEPPLNQAHTLMVMDVTSDPAPEPAPAASEPEVPVEHVVEPPQDALAPGVLLVSDSVAADPDPVPPVET